MSFGLFVKQLQISIGAVLNELQPFEVVEGKLLCKNRFEKLDLHMDIQSRARSFVKRLQILIGAPFNELESYEDCMYIVITM